jgi:GNAT superfamily N-acetyltransferase
MERVSRPETKVGLAEVLRYRLEAGRRRVWEFQQWLYIRHEGAPPAAQPLPAGYHEVRGEELRDGYRDRPQRNGRVARRLADPRQAGLGVRCGDGLVYDTWIWRGAYDEPNTGLRLDPGPGGGVLLDSWTAPEHRGRGLHGRMLERRLAEAARLGLAPLDGLVHLGNAPALRAQRAAGARALERITIIKVLGWRMVRRRPVEWHELDL